MPVRVDNDRRPDINRRFNMGGWPTTAFLTRDGEVITGATYLPAEQMLTALTHVADLLCRARSRAARQAAAAATREGRVGEGMATAARRTARQMCRAAGATAPAARLSPRIVENIVREVAGLYDPLYGGLGTDPSSRSPKPSRCS